jgi:hypothetical protein
MKRMLVFCLCGVGFLLRGDPLAEECHKRNIQLAITRFSSIFTNDIMSTGYDFSAILNEIKDLKSEKVRMGLLSNLADQLILRQEDIWKHNDASWFQRRRTYLMAKAMCSLGGGNIMFKWLKYTELLRSMKTELKLYANINNPDAYRERWIALAKEDLLQRIKEAGTNRNIIISGPVPISGEEREIRAKWAYKCSLKQQIEDYEKRFFDGLKLKCDYDRMSPEDRVKLMRMIKQGLGRYPKWYKKEMDEAAAGRKAVK